MHGPLPAPISWDRRQLVEKRRSRQGETAVENQGAQLSQETGARMHSCPQIGITFAFEHKSMKEYVLQAVEPKSSSIGGIAVVNSNHCR